MCGRGIFPRVDVVSGAACQIFFFPSKSAGRVHGPSGRVRVQSVVPIFFSKVPCKSKIVKKKNFAHALSAFSLFPIQ